MNDAAGFLAPSGELTMVVKRGPGSLFAVGEHDAPRLTYANLREILLHGLPQRGLSDEVNEWRTKNLPNFMRGLWKTQTARKLGVPTFFGALWLKVIRGDGEVVDLGLASLRVVTTAGVNKLVALLNTSDASTATTFKFHGYGTGTTAEASADTALVTELTTQYATDNTRPTGSQTTGGSSNVYRTVGTLTPDSGGTIAVTEHGIFHQASNAGGTLWDRTKFSAVNLDSTAGDSLQTTYDGTFAAGG